MIRCTPPSDSHSAARRCSGRAISGRCESGAPGPPARRAWAAARRRGRPVVGVARSSRHSAARCTRPCGCHQADGCSGGLVLEEAVRGAAHRQGLGVGHHGAVVQHHRRLVGDVPTARAQGADQRGLSGAAGSHEGRGGTGLGSAMQAACSMRHSPARASMADSVIRWVRTWSRSSRSGRETAPVGLGLRPTRRVAVEEHVSRDPPVAPTGAAQNSQRRGRRSSTSAARSPRTRARRARRRRPRRRGGGTPRFGAVTGRTVEQCDATSVHRASAQVSPRRRHRTAGAAVELTDYLRVLRAYWRGVAVFVLLGVALAAVLSLIAAEGLPGRCQRLRQRGRSTSRR